MKYYCKTISADLAEKLKAAGMPIEMQPLYAQEAPNARGIVKAGVGLRCPSYAEVFDWFLDRGYDVEVYLSMTKSNKEGVFQRLYAWIVNAPNQVNEATSRDEEYYSWHEAANAAIEKALTLI